MEQRHHRRQPPLAVFPYQGKQLGTIFKMLEKNLKFRLRDDSSYLRSITWSLGHSNLGRCKSFMQSGKECVHKLARRGDR